MREVNIGLAAEFPDRKLLEIDGLEIGVFKLEGEFFAYLNRCPHLGGPVCQGKMIARVVETIAADRSSQGLEFSKSDINVACPWHGYEFDIRTGRHQGHDRFRLAPVKIKVAAGNIIVSLPG